MHTFVYDRGLGLLTCEVGGQEAFLRTDDDGLDLVQICRSYDVSDVEGFEIPNAGGLAIVTMEHGFPLQLSGPRMPVIPHILDREDGAAKDG